MAKFYGAVGYAEYVVMFTKEIQHLKSVLYVE